jgi:adenine-specific DNA-methyltransferase
MPHLNKIIHGDCIEILKQISDRSIDLIILDPPYWKVINEKWDYQWRTEEDYAQWCFTWLNEISRIIKLSGSLYIFGYLRNLFYLYNHLETLGFIFRQQIVIDKGIRALGGRATKNYKMFPNVTESLLFFIFDSKPFIKNLLKQRQKELGLTSQEINQQLGVKINGGGMWSLYTGNNILAQVPTKEMWIKLQEILKFDYPYENVAQVFNIEMGITDVWNDIDFYAEKRFHPTQKPIKLIERIINASSNKEMIVLDPFMGSGSTALACMNLNRNFIGIEIEEKYVKIAESRINDLLISYDNNLFKYHEKNNINELNNYHQQLNLDIGLIK